MKLLLLSILMLIYSGHSSAKDACVRPFNFDQMFDGLSPSKCDKENDNEPAFCKCVETQMESNVMLRATWNGFEDVKEHYKSEREIYKKRFLNVYMDNLFGAAYQKEILFPGTTTASGTIQTCSPGQMSSEVKKSGESFFNEQKRKLSSLIEKKNKEFTDNKCVKDVVSQPNTKCQDIANKLKEMHETLAKPLQDKLADLCNAGGIQIRTETEKVRATPSQYGIPVIEIVAVAKENKKSAVEQLDEMIAWYRKQGNETRAKELEKTKEDVIAAMAGKDIVRKYAPKTEVPTTRSANQEVRFAAKGSPILEKIPTLALGQVVPQGGCSASTSLAQDLLVAALGQYESDRIKEEVKLDAKSLSGPGTDCAQGDPLCPQFQKLNDKLLTNIGKKFEESNDKSCYTYAEFLTMKGMPSDDLIRALKSAEGDDLVKLLDPPRASSALDQDRLKFLRANPLIAKLSGDQSIKLKLAQGLKKMAAEFKGTKAQKLAAYLKFMQTDLKDAYQSKDAMAITKDNCDQLARLFTGIMVADHFPVVPKSDEHVESAEDMYRRLTACKVTDAGKDAVCDVDATFAKNKMLLINGDKSMLDELDSNEFEEFKKSSCGGYDKHEKETCQAKSPKVCRDSWEPRKEVSRVLNENKVQTEVDSTTTVRVGAGVDSKNDDKKFEQWYDSTVRKTQRRSPVAITGELNRFGDNQAKNEEIVNDAVVPKSFVASAPTYTSSGPTSSSSSSSEGVSNTAPSWLKDLPPIANDPIQMEDVKAAENVSEFLSNDPTQTYEEREQERKNIENELMKVQDEAKALGDEQEKLVDDKIEKFQKQLVEQRKNDTVQMKKDVATPKAVPPPSYLASGLGGGSMGQGVMNNGGGGGSVQRPNTKALNQANYNQVVMAMYDTRKEVSTPSGLKLQDIPANPTVLGLSLKTQDVHPTKEEFAEFVKDDVGQNKLALFLFQKLPKPYQESVINVIHPVTKEVIRMHLFKEGGNFIARPFQRKFKRSAVEGFLKQTL